MLSRCARCWPVVVLGALVDAIDRHRAQVERQGGDVREAYRKLWRVLSEVGLDPGQQDRQVGR